MQPEPPTVPWGGPSGPPPGLPPRRSSGAGTVLAELGVLLAAAFTMTASIAFASLAADARDPGSGTVLVLAWLLGLLLVGLLPLRRRYPVHVCVGLAVATLVLPFDSVAALVALSWVVAHRPARTATWCGALVAAATGMALFRDRMRDPEYVILSIKDEVTDDVVVAPGWVYVAVGVVAVGSSVAVGLLRRARETAGAAVAGQRRQAAVVADLRAEMTRQEERELIAREVHDTVAHQLSLVSLHASALEATGGDAAATREAARDVRAAAHRALEQMRELIGMLRQGDGGMAPHAGEGLTLADLPALVDDARAAGAPIRATVFVTDGEAAPVALTRAVYRIVQEAMTNALRHAPGAEVGVDVRAAPGEGARIRVANRVGAVVGTPTGAGAGVRGMRERAALLGGTLEAGVVGAEFVVSAELPWPRSTSGARR